MPVFGCGDDVLVLFPIHASVSDLGLPLSVVEFVGFGNGKDEGIGGRINGGSVEVRVKDLIALRVIRSPIHDQILAIIDQNGGIRSHNVGLISLPSALDKRGGDLAHSENTLQVPLHPVRPEMRRA